jgi:predicted porin
MGKTDLIAMYGVGEGETTAGAGARDRTGMMLGAMHNLSKRTAVYGLYGSQDMKYVQAISGGAAAGTKEKISSYSVGLRHSF